MEKEAEKYHFEGRLANPLLAPTVGSIQNNIEIEKRRNIGHAAIR
jgi:hypothetical protein